MATENEVRVEICRSVDAPNGAVIRILSDGTSCYVTLYSLAKALGYSGFTLNSPFLIAGIRNSSIPTYSCICSGHAGSMLSLKLEDVIPYLQTLIRCRPINASATIYRRKREAQRLAKDLIPCFEQVIAELGDKPAAESSAPSPKPNEDVGDEYRAYVTVVFGCPKYLFNELDALANALGCPFDELLVDTIKDLVKQHKSAMINKE